MPHWLPLSPQTPAVFQRTIGLTLVGAVADDGYALVNLDGGANRIVVQSRFV